MIGRAAVPEPYWRVYGKSAMETVKISFEAGSFCLSLLVLQLVDGPPS